MKSKALKNIVRALVGGVMLIGGITLVLVWWPSVVAVFRGVAGGLLAIAGLFILFLIKE